MTQEGIELAPTKSIYCLTEAHFCQRSPYFLPARPRAYAQRASSNVEGELVGAGAHRGAAAGAAPHVRAGLGLLLAPVPRAACTLLLLGEGVLLPLLDGSRVDVVALRRHEHRVRRHVAQAEVGSPAKVGERLRLPPRRGQLVEALLLQQHGVAGGLGAVLEGEHVHAGAGRVAAPHGVDALVVLASVEDEHVRALRPVLPQRVKR
eukprot:scaffold37705_cov74-Phaeocystis_antarctica.AAC.2